MRKSLMSSAMAALLALGAIAAVPAWMKPRTGSKKRRSTTQHRHSSARQRARYARQLEARQIGNEKSVSERWDVPALENYTVPLGVWVASSRLYEERFNG